MRKWLCLWLVCLLLPAWAAAEVGLSYADFETRYAENVFFINENAQRHMLPHTPERDFDAQGRRIYRIDSGALGMEMYLASGGERIVSCEISLTAPQDMPYGSAQHNDFTISGYHAYALLMAMSPAPTAYERYALVEEVNNGLAAGDRYETQVGDFRLICTRNGNAVTLRFVDEAQITPMPAPGEGDEPSGEEDVFIG